MVMDNVESRGPDSMLKASGVVKNNIRKIDLRTGKDSDLF